MSKKEHSVKRQHNEKQAASTIQTKTQNELTQTPGWVGVKLWLGLIVAITAFLLYSNTLNHQYVLDDYSLIKENPMTQKGTKAIGEIFKTGYRTGHYSTDHTLYRPLSKAMFAIEWQIAPDSPQLSHWINVILFALSCVVLFHVLSLFLSGNVLVAFITSMLFAAHPIHTEVVANIKSRDEILSFLFVLLSVWSVYKYVSAKRLLVDKIPPSGGGGALYLLLASSFFFLSLLSKESSITFLAVIPLMIYFFTETKASKTVAVTISLCLVTAIFLVIRRNVLGHVEMITPMIDNYLVSIRDFATQKATAIFLLGVYLKTLVFPHPLFSDGSYHQFPIVSAGDWRFLLSAVVFLGLIVYSLMKFKKKDVISFSVLFFLITASVASNIPFLIGTNYGERLMYVPSLGLCLAIGALIGFMFTKQPKLQLQTSNLKHFFKGNSKAIGLTLLIVCLYSIKTISRNTDWHDNLTLYREEIINAPNSARNHFYLGNQLTQEDFLSTVKDRALIEKYTQEGIAELNKAIEISPEYGYAYHKLANIYMMRGDNSRAEPLFVKAIEQIPTSPMFLNNYGTLLLNTGRNEEAKEKFETAIQYNPYFALAYNNLGKVYGVYGQDYKKQMTQSQVSNDQESTNKNKQLAMENYGRAINYFQQAIKLDPTLLQAYYLLGITYKSIGDGKNANYYMNVYLSMKK